MKWLELSIEELIEKYCKFYIIIYFLVFMIDNFEMFYELDM